ncbi:MAG: DUF6719 family protein [Vicinamibacteria bacterium]
MNRVTSFVAVLATAGALLSPICRADVTILPQMPKEGELAQGEIVYVDDGKCAKASVKEVIGGSREKGILRQVRCVKRPAAKPSS